MAGDAFFDVQQDDASVVNFGERQSVSDGGVIRVAVIERYENARVNAGGENGRGCLVESDGDWFSGNSHGTNPRPEGYCA